MRSKSGHKRKGKRVLIVEDEMMIAMHMEDVITSLGHHVVSSANRMETAMQIASDIDIDLAVLDINLAGRQSYPVADILQARGIPFIFATGYGGEGLPKAYCHACVLGKPFDVQELARTIAFVFR